MAVPIEHGAAQGGPFQGLATTEAALAVEIAESVRRSLAEEETRRGVTPRRGNTMEGAWRGAGYGGRPGGLAGAAGSLRGASLGSQASATLFQTRPVARGRGRHRSSWDFPREFRWYTEIAEAVAHSLAEEVRGPLWDPRQPSEASPNVPSDAASGVDPNALANLQESVLRFADHREPYSHGVDPSALAGLEESVLRFSERLEPSPTSAHRLHLPPACRRHYHQMRSRSASAVEVAENVRRALAEEDSHRTEVDVANDAIDLLSHTQ